MSSLSDKKNYHTVAVCTIGIIQTDHVTGNNHIEPFGCLLEFLLHENLDTKWLCLITSSGVLNPGERKQKKRRNIYLADTSEFILQILDCTVL